MAQIIMSSTYSAIEELADPARLMEWKTVAAGLTGIKHHINRVGHPMHQIPEPYFSSLATLMQTEELELWVETKSYYEPDMGSFDLAGKLDAQKDILYLERAENAGICCTDLELDGAFYDYIRWGMKPEQAIACLTEYGYRIRDAYPDIRLHLLFNLPNWGFGGAPAYRTDNGTPMYMGDILSVYRFLMPALRENGVGIRGLVIDNPYEYAVAMMPLTDKEKTGIDLSAEDWIGRILKMERLAREDKYTFALIYNTQEAGVSRPELYTERTLRFLQLYHERGGRPDIYEFESWYPNPLHFLPEDDRLSMTGTVNVCMQQMKDYGLTD